MRKIARDDAKGDRAADALGESRERFRFLAEAGMLLASSLDYETRLRNVARLMVPQIADWCGVDVLGEDGSIQRLAVMHVDPAKEEWAYELSRRYPPDLNASSGLGSVLRTGRSEFYPQITDVMLEASARDPTHLQLIRQVGFVSAMIVALVARDRTLGAITFVSAESGRHYSADDLAMAEELAVRAALAIDNARLYREAREQREWLRGALSSIGDAVITTDMHGDVTFLNPVAEALTGWPQAEAAGRPLSLVFRIVNEATRATVENPVDRVLREGTVVGLANHTLLLARSGAEIPIDDSGAPIRDAEGRINGVVLVFRDITERKRAELVQVRLASIVESSDDAIISKTLDGIILSWNAGAERMYGYTAEEVIGRSVSVIFPPDRLDELSQILDRLKRGEHIDHYETERVRKNGARISISLSISPMRDAAGQIVAASTIARDITERKRAEQELRRSRDQLDIILRGVADGITVQDPSGRLIYANDMGAQLSGYPSAQALLEAPLQEIIQRFELLDEAGQPLPVSQLPGRLALQGVATKSRMVGFRVLATGEERWSIVSATPILDEGGRVQLAINFFQDMTERRRAEQEQRFLSEASSLLAASLDYETTLASVARLVVPTIADWCAVDLVDEGGGIRRLAVAHVDPAKVELAHEVQRRYPPDPNVTGGIQQVLRTGRPEVFSHISDAMLAGAARDAEQLAIWRGLGMKSLMLVPLGARGQRLGVISFAAAESGRRYGPNDLALAEDLAYRAAVAIENARLYREAQEAVRIREVFLSVASHELKTPLTTLLGNAQLFQRRAIRDGSLNERDLRSLQLVVDQGMRLNRMIEALLDLSRIETGQLSIERTPLDLVALTRRMVDEAQPALEQHQIVYNPPDEPLIVVGDELRLEQVIQNLIQNAIKYSPSGGRIDVQVARRGDRACVDVTDQGIGIPKAALPRLFTRFYRASNVNPQHISGMGIGLYVVKEILNLHGGEIALTSREGEGSTFTICLPTSDERPTTNDQRRVTSDE